MVYSNSLWLRFLIIRENLAGGAEEVVAAVEKAVKVVVESVAILRGEEPEVVALAAAEEAVCVVVTNLVSSS
jgi:hypothetical protein